MNRGSLHTRQIQSGLIERDEPKFARDAQVLRAPHKGVTFTRFGGGWDPRVVKILLFTSCNSH